MKTPCDLARTADGWLCPACGRLVRSQSAVRPLAICGAAKQPGDQAPLPAPTHGPGTELSRLLERFGIKATPACKCRAVAARMDAWGCDECARPERIDEVIAVMREEAGKRGLPFLDAAGRMLVRRAISRARAIEREAENSRSQEG